MKVHVKIRRNGELEYDETSHIDDDDDLQAVVDEHLVTYEERRIAAIVAQIGIDAYIESVPKKNSRQG